MKSTTQTGINWNAITGYNFTHALPGGAWLEDSSGYRNWYPWHIILDKLGRAWIDRQTERQSFLTGAWITVEN